jgi:hypothetical protein
VPPLQSTASLGFHGQLPHRFVSQTLELARTKAAGLRELQLWVIKSGPFTFTDLAQRLATTLRTIVDGRWYELPEAQVPQGAPSRARRWVAVLAAAITLVAIAVLLAFSVKLGSVTDSMVLILGALFIGMLNAAGLPAPMIGQYLESSGRLFKGGK